jgi:hypothetical protein
MMSITAERRAEETDACAALREIERRSPRLPTASAHETWMVSRSRRRG